jgi:hypothetical protein
MARAVATLEGDSSSLVDAIDKAKGSMQKLDVEGKKLTDQLRDVADQADVAAGALVNKIGGPGAIKAIAGVGAAFVAAETALGAFSASMSAYASTQGAAGQQAMADLDKAVNELHGQLFTAVMGTDDMAEAMDTVVTVVKAATVVVQALLSPLSVLTTGIRTLATNSSDAEVYQRKLAAAERDAAKATDTVSTSVVTLNQKYKDVEGTLVKLLGTKKEAALFDLQNTTNELMGVIRLAEVAEFNRLKIAGDLAADRAELEARENAADSGEGGGAEMLDLDITRIRDEARAKETARLAEEMKGQDLRKLRTIAGLQELEKQRQDIISGRVKLEENTPTGGGGAPPAAPELTDMQEMGAVFAEAAAKQAAASAKAYADGIDAIVAAERAKEKATADRISAEDAQAKAVAAARRQEFGDASSAEISAYLDAKTQKEIADQTEFEAARQRAIELHDLTFNFQQTAAEFAAGERAKEKAAHDEKVNQLTAGFQEYGKLAGQQLAEGEKGAKVAEKLAKKALGAQISALGDKAMVEAAIYAAAFNPIAIPMAAAGVAAYAAAAALGAEGKKATTATPASAAPAAAPVNTAFNLRVDAAFADGESIARQFAMMQRSAQRRGLVPAGA